LDHSTGTAPSITCTVGTECNVSTSSDITSTSFPITVDTTGEDLIHIPSGEGMGTVHVGSFYWLLTIPLDAYAGTYQSTIALNFNSGP
jgi:hypothetical protein